MSGQVSSDEHDSGLNPNNATTKARPGQIVSYCYIVISLQNTAIFEWILLLAYTQLS